MPVPRRRLSLLAVELDGYSASSLERARQGVHDTIIVAQQPSETPAKFAARLIERIARVRTEGAIVARASLACNGHGDVEAIAARILVVRTMLAANPDLGDSDVCLSSTSSALRHQLAAIREALREHGLVSAPPESELEVVAPGSAPLQRVA